jgi:Probable zinc-ribbon domain
MSILKNNDLVSQPVCPGCKKTKSQSETQQLEKKLNHYFETNPHLTEFIYQSNIDTAYEFYTSSSIRWACDKCLTDGISIAAKVEEQTYCIWQPYMAYVDQKIICKTCNTNFIFSKEEQLFWYEKLKFWVESYAINCKKCRKVKRDRKNLISQAQKDIAKFLPDFDKWNIEHLERVIHLYELTESKRVVQQYKIQLEKLKKIQKLEK